MAEHTGPSLFVRSLLGEGARSLVYGVVGALAVAGTFFALHARDAGDRAGITPGLMPACDSPVSRRGLVHTITNAPGAKLVGLTVQKVDTVSELAASEAGPSPEQRVCLATVYTNAGRKLVGFTLAWANAAKDDVYLELPYGID